MKISLTSGLHLTATNKRHLAEMIEQKMTSGSSGKISYELETLAEGAYRAVIRKKESDDWGRPVTRKMTVEFTATA